MEIEREQPLHSIMQLTLQTHAYLNKHNLTKSLFINNIHSLLYTRCPTNAYLTTLLNRIYVFLNMGIKYWN